MTKYFDEKPAYSFLKMKWEVESEEELRSKAKTLTGQFRKTCSTVGYEQHGPMIGRQSLAVEKKRQFCEIK